MFNGFKYRLVMIAQLIFLASIFAGTYEAPDVGVTFVGRTDSPQGWGFQGKLWENSSVVVMIPEIRTAAVKGISKTMNICGYTVHHESLSFFPFIVLLIDQKRGLAEVRLKSNLPRETLNSLYTFQIEGYDCDIIPHFSERKFVLVEVKTSLRPVFKELSYHFSVKVNSPVGFKVGTISAYERPEKVNLGICKYKIISDSMVPFIINEYGVLTTKTLTLDKAKSKRYMFTVQASDCQLPVPETTSVPVTIDVFDDCKPHWTGLSPSIDYDEEKGVLPIVSNNLVVPSLHLCSTNCQALSATLTIKLQGKDIRPANISFCKHDERSLKRQEMLCDVSKKGLDMLKFAPEFLKDIKLGGFYFNAYTAIKVDPKVNNFGHKVGRKFTIMFWMKHADMAVKGLKEQILCNSDGEGHNRHHFSLFLHNCKLILLFRKEFVEASQSQYEPTEWRYGPLKEACDDKWHHYAILFNNGELFVQIDGEMTTAPVQHLDDKPLMELSIKPKDTKLTVGACYHAKSDKFVQYFNGHLASLKVLDDHLEAINNIRCIATCGEALLLPHIMDLVGIQSSATIFSDSVVIRSYDIFNLLKMFSSLSYINTEILNEVHGKENIKRTVTIDADISCNGIQIQKPALETIIINLQSKKPAKVIKPSPLSISIRESVQGYKNEKIPLFPYLKFVQDGNTIEDIQSCIIRPVGGVIESWEYIDWPITSVINFHLTGVNNSHGLVLDGSQSIKVYEMLLMNTYYLTRKYDSVEPRRKFAVSCSFLDKTVTKEVVVTVELKSNDLKTYYVVDDPSQNQNEEIALGNRQQGSSNKIGFDEKMNNNVPKTLKKGSTSTVALWVIFVSLLIVVVAAVLCIVIFYRKMKNHKTEKGTLFNMEERRRQSRLKVTTNPLHHEGVMSEDFGALDEESITNEVPDSEADYLEDGDEYDEEEYKEEMVKNVFPRIPSSTKSTHSVNV